MIPKITLMAFPQKQEGNSLFINVLSIVRNYNPLTTTDLNPAWVDADLRLQAIVIDALDDYPRVGLASTAYDLSEATIPAQAKNIFTSLESRFKITKTANNLDAAADMKDFQVMKKYLPLSYREAFNFTTPRNKSITVTGDEYHCAIKNNPKPDPLFAASITDETSWGEVFGFCLRNKELAKKCGFIHEMLEVKLNENTFKNGGWLYIDLHPECSYYTGEPGDADYKANFVKRYAARIPKLDLTKSRDIFTAVAFPVLLSNPFSGPDDPVAPSTAILDQMFTEAASYDDGFCKIVHNYQPVSNHLLKEEQDDESPVTSDIGIRLGWEDEQIAEWLSRQMIEDPGTGKKADAPLGVYQYRTDVREKVKEGDPVNNWNSLCRVRNDKDVFLDEVQIGGLDEEMEMGIDVFPAKPDAGPGTHYWLPSYFTQWIGKSLALQDEDAIAIYHKEENIVPNLEVPNDFDAANDLSYQATKNAYYKAAGLENVQLLYGHEYEFRIRMADITGGGPTVDMEPQYDAPSPITNCLFKRHVIPQQVNFLSPLPVDDSLMYTESAINLIRPLLGYPAVLFTGAYKDVVKKLIADADDILAKNLNRGVGLADPDVDTVEITVEVKSLALDTTIKKLHAKDNFALLYITRRAFDDHLEKELDIELNFIDAPVLHFNGDTQMDKLGLNTSGNNDINVRRDLVLPTARDIRITVRAITKSKIDYYGGIDEKGLNRKELKGQLTTFLTRKEAKSEINFFKSTGENMMIRGLYLQPEEPIKITENINTLLVENLAFSNEPPTLMDKISAAIGADCKGMSLLGKQGQRWQFGVSRFIRNTAAPDNTSITFATKNDLLNHWLVPITILVDRDWSWDGVVPTSVSVYRRKMFLRDILNILEITDREKFLEDNSTADIMTYQKILEAVDEELVGDISFKQAINISALINSDRSQTYACFIDAIEPKQNDPDSYPDEIFVAYRLEINFIKQDETILKDKDLKLFLHLPITTPPAEMPKIVSAGISMSPYVRDVNYANTETREKYLWVEFARPLKNADDTFFVRMLAYAPDVLLARWEWDLFVAKKEPVLPLDPEFIRIISPASSDDRAGLFAMQEMIPSTNSRVHYILPLPPGMHADSLEMFGLFTYEFRVGHKIPWTTAHGRFGRALRSTGIQHPSPQLYCSPDRNERYISVSAPYAQTVFDGRNVTSKPPRTEIWALLYAQVRMADDSDMRNILLSDKKLRIMGNLKHEYLSPQKSDKTPQGITKWQNKEVEELLNQLGLPEDSPLSVLCVEMMPGYENFFVTRGRGEYFTENYEGATIFGSGSPNTPEEDAASFKANLKDYVGSVNEGLQHMQNKIKEEYVKRYSAENSDSAISVNNDHNQEKPLTTDLGFHRILRTSTLVEVPAVCCTE